MADLSDLLPLFQRDEATIRADWDARANAGLTADDPDWVDTREGGLFYIASQGAVIECARLWDALTEVVAAVNLGTSWGDYLDLWAGAFGLERNPAVAASGEVTFTGAEGTLIGVDAIVGTVQTDPDIEPPEFAVTESGTIPAGGTLTLPVQAKEAGTDGNVDAHTITRTITPLDVTGVDNADPLKGGAEVESDLALRAKILTRFGGSGGGNQADYVRWVLDWGNGIGQVTVIPAADGPGTVTVIVATETGDPVAAQTVTDLQAFLDPDPGQGAGRAPVGHAVTVQTVTDSTVVVAATITYLAGYSADGANGTVAVGQPIKDAIKAYVNARQPGEDVVYNHARAAPFLVQGVLDVPAFTLNGGTADVAIASPGQATCADADITLS